MKKAIAILLAVLVCMGTAAYASAGLANPWTEASSQEIAAATGLALVIPDGADAVCSYMDGMAQAAWTADGVDIVERVSPADAAPAMDSETLTALSGVYFAGATDSKELVVGGRCPGYMEFVWGSYGAIMWYDEALGVVYTLSLDPVSDPKEMGDLADTITPLESGEGETSMLVYDGCAIAHDLTAVPVDEIENEKDFLWKVVDGYGITYTDDEGVIWGIYRAGEAGVFEIVVSSEETSSPWAVGDQIWVGGSKLVELCVEDGRLTHVLTDELVSGPAYDVTIVNTAGFASGEASGESSGEASGESDENVVTFNTINPFAGEITVIVTYTGDAESGVTLVSVVDPELGEDILPVQSEDTVQGLIAQVLELIG